MGRMTPTAASGTGTEVLTDRWRRVLADERSTRIALADGEDARAVGAALRLHADGDLTPILVGRPDEVARAARSTGVELPSDLEVIDPSDGAHSGEYQEAIGRLPASKNLSSEEILRLAQDPVVVAALMVRLGNANAAVAGSSRPTADVVRVGLQVIGLASGIRTVSSCFLMSIRPGHTLGYGDCVVLPLPTEDQLADVAISTSATYARFTGEEPLVAMLSFSTKGSASHESLNRVRGALEIVRHRAPSLAIDGELQFDAAYVPAVAAVKAPGSTIAGRANVFIFPDLQAGNIGYKITERLCGATALGPILQGLAAPLNDLSRGCSVDDIATTALLSAVQSIEQRRQIPDTAARTSIESSNL